MKGYRRLWIALIVMALLSPVGLYLPRIMKAGSAWGEWGMDEVKRMIGYVPAGMQKTENLWKAPIRDYTLPGQEGASLSRVSFSYILSALIGLALCAGAGYLVARRPTGRQGKRRT